MKTAEQILEIYNLQNEKLFGRNEEEIELIQLVKEIQSICQKEHKEKLRFIPIEEKLPENGDEIELQNNDWINEYNPKGIRSGYYDKCKNPIFYSCYWNTDEECYDTSTQPPTHWRSFL